VPPLWQGEEYIRSRVSDRPDSFYNDTFPLLAPVIRDFIAECEEARAS
jgi:hypothetical protein